MRDPSRVIPALAIALLSAGLLSAGLLSAAPAPSALREGRGGDGDWLEASLPGPVIAALVVGEGSSAARTLLLLTAPAEERDGPRSLYRLELPAAGGGTETAGRLTLLRQGLPGEAKALVAVDLGADGVPEILLGGLGTLDSLGEVASLEASGPPRRLLSHPGFDLRSLSPERIRVSGAGETWLGAAEAGALRLWRVDGRGGLEGAAELRLPVVAAREPAGLALTSPRPTPLLRAEEAAADGGPRELPAFAVGPLAHGKRRLRTALLAAGGEGGEAWSLLPGPEAVEQSWYLPVDGRPVLFAAAQSADRMGIFETRQLRVFPLQADRTRAGKGPLFTHETAARRWFAIDLAVRDLTGDGKDDLVLLFREGLGGGELVAEAFPGLGGGRFLRQPRRSKLDPAPEAWSYGADLTGDGLADLIALGETEAAVYPGEAKGRRVVSRRPRWSVSLPAPVEKEQAAVEVRVGEGEAPPPSPFEPELASADLDGDGRPELLRISPGQNGGDQVLVVRFGGGGPG